MRAAIYARISLDRKEGAGVARQLADCRKLVAERGWEVGGEYVDNDLSAFRAKRRPEWDRLLEDLAGGRVDALVCYHPDRTYRKTADLERLIDIVEATGAEVATVKAGDIDLATATGRMAARIVAAVSRHESERIGERVSRAKRERAAQGRPSGGGVRAFGWKADKVALEPSEARLLRSAAKRVAAGGSIGGEVRRLNTAGVTTTTGRPWTVAALRRVLTSPRIAGLRSYRGEIVGPAEWRAIIDEPTWRRLVLMAEGRRGRPLHPDTLLSALITCPHCGAKLYAKRTANPPAYFCLASTRGGCGGASIAMAAADAKVEAEVVKALEEPHVAVGLVEHPKDYDAEEAAILAKRIELTRRWSADELSDAEYDAARAVLNARLDAISSDDVPTLPVDRRRLLEAWGTATVMEKRAIIATVVERIDLAPGRMANPQDRVSVTFR